MAVTIPFVPPIEVTSGAVDELSPLVRHIVAENPSKYTYLGTGTYIVGHGDVAVVDPGPTLDTHRQALATALAGERVRAILVTHCHGDHSPLSAWLKEGSGTPTYAFGPHGALPEPDDQDGEMKPEEVTDIAFEPDVRLADGEVVEGNGWTFTALHTPGHTSNHLCYALAEESTVFTGDHVMGWSTTVISPPDGNIRDYIASLHKLLGRDDAVLRPTHGGPVTDVRPFLEAYLAHRLEREAGVLGRPRRADPDPGHGRRALRRRPRGAPQARSAQRLLAPREARRRRAGGGRRRRRCPSEFDVRAGVRLQLSGWTTPPRTRWPTSPSPASRRVRRRGHTDRAWPELENLFEAQAPIHVDTVNAAVIEIIGQGSGEFVGGSIERFEFFEFVILTAVVEVDSATEAHGRMYMQELRQDRSNGGWTDAYGVYHDRYRHDGSRWRFAERHYQSLARTGRMEVFPFPAAHARPIGQ